MGNFGRIPQGSSFPLPEAARGGEADAPDFVASACVWPKLGDKPCSADRRQSKLGRALKAWRLILQVSDGINM